MASAAAVSPSHGVFGPADDRDVLLGQFAKLVEVALFVLAAELGGAGQQFVFDGDGRAASEFGVERAQQCVLAAGGGCEVGCAVDDAGLGPVRGDEHDATVCELYDIHSAERTLRREVRVDCANSSTAAVSRTCCR